jgi:long-chain acyl-CoA synthetase
MRAKTFGEGASAWQALQYRMAELVALRKIRAALGLDRVKFLTSGSAPLHVDTAMTFLGMGVPIMQGYGLTETSPATSVSRLTANEYGAVGRPIAGVDLAFADDGELLVRGRNVMQGYYRDPEATAAAIENGWLRTGDIAEIDARGFLRITDRKGEIFKTGNGKWIAPARIEASIKRSIFIAQAMVVGNGRPHPIALICPNWALVKNEIPGWPPEAAPEALALRDDVRAFLTHEVHRQTETLANWEQVRRIVIVPREFSVEGGELSPSMKIKRRVVEKRYAAEIDAAYDPAGAAHVLA